ncbi:MAG: MFS transporter [Candidatus Bathyarchaeia archaeon]
MSLESESERQSHDGYRWVMLLLAWLIYFCFGLVCFSLAPLVTPVMGELNLTYTQIGFAAGVWPLIYIAFAYPEGFLIDRLGLRISLFLGLVIIAASSMLRALAFDFLSLFGSIAIFGLGAPMVSVGLPKLVATWFTGRERGTASGVYFTGVSSGTAFSLGATNTLLLPSLGGWRICFLIYGSVALATSILWLCLGKPAHSKIEEGSGEEHGVWGEIAGLIKYRNVWLIIVMGSTTFIVAHSLNNWLPKILESSSFQASTAGLLAATFSLFRIVGSLGIPRISYMFRSRKIVISSTLLVIAVSILLLTVGGEWWVGSGIIAVGVGVGALPPLLLTVLMDMPEVGSRRMGAAGGLYFSFGEVGGVLGPTLIGFLRDSTGSFITGLTAIASLVTCMVILSLFMKEPPST